VQCGTGVRVVAARSVVQEQVRRCQGRRCSTFFVSDRDVVHDVRLLPLSTPELGSRECVQGKLVLPEVDGRGWQGG
jgi:hypothetical protein